MGLRRNWRHKVSGIRSSFTDYQRLNAKRTQASNDLSNA